AVRGGADPGGPRATVAPVVLGRDHTQARLRLRQVLEHALGAVARAVVDDDDLTVDADPVEGRRRRLDHGADGRLVVVTGKERRNGLHRRVHRRARHTNSISSSAISGKQGSETHSAAHDSASGHGSRTYRRYAGCWVSARG